MKAIIWDPAAREQYDDALAKSQDASAFRTEVDDALANIASGTLSHAKIPRTDFRRCILTRLPYSIIYSETDDEVVVAVFPHHSQRPAS